MQCITITEMRKPRGGPRIYRVVLLFSLVSLCQGQSSLNDPCNPAVAPDLTGVIIIGKRSADDPGTPHGKKINCTTTSLPKTTDAVSTRGVVTSGIVSTLGNTLAYLTTKKVPLLKTASETIAEITTEERRAFTELKLSSVRSSAESSRQNSKTNTVEPEIIKATTAKTTKQSQTVKNSKAPSTTSVETTRSSASTIQHSITTGTVSSKANGPSSTGTKSWTIRVTPSVMDGGSSSDSSDNFDHELAIIFGSMLGLMLLAFFCFGVLRCYRKEKFEFQKSQENFNSVTP